MYLYVHIAYVTENICESYEKKTRTSHFSVLILDWVSTISSVGVTSVCQIHL